MKIYYYSTLVATFLPECVHLPSNSVTRYKQAAAFHFLIYLFIQLGRIELFSAFRRAGEAWKRHEVWLARKVGIGQPSNVLPKPVVG
ncbi:hypothetical protein BDZ91DRAFT_727886 [Kalaharituber pfeilii]|nr:hypothetical protein BDZ91DRAFT_727886 [Kalaharituber pfeilii]